MINRYNHLGGENPNQTRRAGRKKKTTNETQDALHFGEKKKEMRLFRTSRPVAAALVFLSISIMPLIPALETTANCCAEGWDFFPETNSCYFIPKTTEKKDMKSWGGAKSFCEQLPVNGSGVPRLVDITSEEEQKFLEETITSYNFT